jgi:hypothetical protein
LARALIVGCGCRGRELGRRLVADGWAVRGTTRDFDRRAEIDAAGLEGAEADPDLAGTVLDHVGDVTAVYWLLASATGAAEKVDALHGPRLERVLEKLVDTPVRGFVYEACGTVETSCLEAGAAAVAEASRRWHIPAEVVDADPAHLDVWVDAMAAAAQRLIGA